jgi:SAM-dependent methyltransferase
MDSAKRQMHKVTGSAWDVTAKVYRRDLERDIGMLRRGEISLQAPELGYLNDLGSWCKRAVHLQCAGGTDTLSLWKLGAAEVVGVDISAQMIAVAELKSMALQAPARWHCCDVIDTPHELDGAADLVYTGKGALPWMMDIEAWASVVARLLRPGGRLYVYEGHPLDWVWDMEASTYQLSPHTGSYFSEQVAQDRGWPMSSDPIREHADRDRLHVHERQWTLGQIMNSLVAAGLRLARFEEHPDMFWNQFPNLPADLASRLPHTFSLLMHMS